MPRFSRRRVVVAVQNRDLFLLSILWNLFANAISGALHERHRAQVIELASARLPISGDHPFSQLLMKGAFHPGRRRRVPTFNVIERSFFDRILFT